MTELEKIAYARTYIDKLANGINPLDDSPVSEDDVVNNVRITRCFFFVSDILRQVVENGGIKPRKKSKDDERLPFSITQEQLSGYSYEQRLPVTKVISRINSLIDVTKYKELAYKQVVKFLVDAGVLEIVTTPSGKQKKRPTELGNSIGILVERRHSQNGDYDVIEYNPQVQKFILDNIDSIIKTSDS